MVGAHVNARGRSVIWAERPLSMANQIHKFRDRDVQRLIKAARSAGLDPGCVEVDPHTGRIKVHTREASETGVNPWDRPATDKKQLPHAADKKRTA
jgi:hypothetical protein